MKQAIKNTFIERLPPTFLESVCHGTTMVIGDYIIKKDYDTSKLILNNFLLEDGAQYPLLILEDIARLERKYRLDNDKKISGLQKEMLNVEDDLSDADINTFQTTLQLKNYIVGKILPAFGISDDGLVSQVDTVLSNRKTISNNEFNESNLNRDESISYSSGSGDNDLFAQFMKSKHMQQARSEEKKSKSTKNIKKGILKSQKAISKDINSQSIFTKDLLKGQNVYMHYEKVYSLSNTPYFEELLVNYLDNEFFPFPGIEIMSDERIFNIALLRRAYRSVLIDKLEREAFDNNPYKQKMTILNQKLDAIITGDFMQKAGIGVEFISPTTCYLTKKINEFVLKDNNTHKLHYFAPTRVGVEIKYNKNNSVSHGPVVVMDKYMPFPFLNSDKPITSLCTGNGKEVYENYSLPDEVQIVQKINIGEHTMYRGYKGSFTPYSYLNNEKYTNDNKTHRIITKKEMDDLKLTPSNV